MWQQYYLASSVEDALEMLERWGGQARLIAGGTDVLIDVREGKYQPACLVDISRIPGLDDVGEDESFIIVGACTTFHNLWTSPLIQEKARLLAEAAGHLGAWTIQNVATLGGNVVTAQPAGDGSIALLALGAEAEIAR
ncbi:MAG: FAD binding domain-containing protein, partial [Candidatus Micrarchaeaceae archaeon]